MDLNYAHYENRKGVLPISWEDYHSICRGLALAAAHFDPQVILGVARGGLYAGTLVAHLLRKDFYAVYLSRRHLDQKVSDQPRWLMKPPELVRGQRVLVVDEICGSGDTLRGVKAQLARMGAGEARCAVMYAHTWGTETPDYIGLVSDALILNPWDREIVEGGEIVYHPEYVYALGLQGIPPGQALPMVGVKTWKPEKGG
jgi:uncharacterized protein